MNVIEAIEKLRHYDDKIKALDLALSKLDSPFEREILEEIETLKEIKHEIFNKREQLQNRLEKTKLVNLR